MKTFNSNKFYFGALVASVLLLVGINNPVLSFQWATNKWNEGVNTVKDKINENIVAPVTQKVDQVSNGLQTAANEVENADKLFKDSVAKLHSTIGEVDTTLSGIKTVQGQMSAGTAEAERIWGSTTPIVIGALAQVRDLPQVAEAARAIKSGSQSLQKVATITGDGLQKIQAITLQIRNALDQVSKVTGIVRQISGVVNTVGTKVSSAGGSVGITNIERIGNSVADIGTQMGGIGGAIDRLSLSLGEALNRLDEFSRQSQAAASSIAITSGSIAQNL